MSHLTSKVPAALKKSVVPFLQRADELEGSKQIFPAYFVRTYAAQEVLKKRDPQDPEQKAFLLEILGYLETFQKENKAELAPLDGRTVITKLALTLFDRADEQEREGQCTPAICKMLFTASILFECTKQFNDGKMDPIAASKYKYARFVAGKMTKCLKEGTKYEPVNQQTTDEQLGGAEQAKETAAAAERTAAGLQFQEPSASASSNQQNELASQLPSLPPVASHTPSSTGSTNLQPPPPPPPPAAPYQNLQPASTTPTTTMPPPPPPAQDPLLNQQQYQHQHQQYQQPQPSPGVPSPVAPDPPQQPQQQFQAPPPPPPASSTASPAVQQQQQQHFQPPPPPPASTAPPPPPPASSTTSSSSAAGRQFDTNPNEDELDKVMNSQKWAKQAIAALQFADVNTAKIMLNRALAALG